MVAILQKGDRMKTEIAYLIIGVIGFLAIFWIGGNIIEMRERIVRSSIHQVVTP